jgi:hypothetical protein
MKKLKHSQKTSLLTLGVFIPFLITACSLRSPVWSESGQSGPPLAHGSPTRQVEKCDFAKIELFPAGGKACAYAFASKDGVMIPFGDVHQEVEKSLPMATQLRPLLRNYRAQYQKDPKKWTPYPTYRLYLVALRPTLVIGIPMNPDESGNCNALGGQECFRIGDPGERAVGSFSGWSFGLYYSKLPPVRTGSFAYVPKWGTESVEIPVDRPRFSLLAGDQEIVLAQVNGLWQLAQ